jgi:putative cell wall-binding protein
MGIMDRRRGFSRVLGVALTVCMTLALSPLSAAWATEGEVSSAEKSTNSGLQATVSTGINELAARLAVGDGGLSAEALAVESAESLSMAAVNWQRLEGEGRYDTMAAITQAGFASSEIVILATGANFPDALAASGLAGLGKLPILLTDSQSLSAQTQAEIARLGAKRVIIIGGEGAVSPVVAETLLGLLGEGNVARISGDNRYQTARYIYEAGKEATDWNWGTTAIVVTGNKFADALSISPYSYATQSPIFLYDSVNQSFDSETLAAIQSGGFTKILLVGGTNALPDSINDALALGAGTIIERWAGDDRYRTSAQVAARAVVEGALGLDRLAVATGKNYPDALCGGALSGINGSTLLLADDSFAGRYAVNYIAGIGTVYKGIANGYLLGGTGALTPALEGSIKGLGVHESFEQQVLDLVNAERAKMGVAPLSTDPVLILAAEIRAGEVTQLFSHTRPDGRNWSTVYDELSYSWSAAGENIAVGYASPSAVVSAWMNSAGHRGNILSPYYTTLGVGYTWAESTEYRHHWVQMFT